MTFVFLQQKEQNEFRQNDLLDCDWHHARHIYVFSRHVYYEL